MSSILLASLANDSFSAPQTEPFFVLRPFLTTLQAPGRQGIRVNWQYGKRQAPVDSQLKLYRDGKLVETFRANESDRLRWVELPMPPCGFGDSLRYQITGQTQSVPIIEIPCPESKRIGRFSFFSDTQQRPKEVQKLASLVLSFPGQGLINGGDIVQTGSKEKDWVDYFEAMSLVGQSRVLFPAVGNHEYRRDQTIPYWERFFGFSAKEAHYAFDIGEARIIVLNSCFEDDPDLIESQQDWIKAELQKPSRWKIVIYHHPAYSLGLANYIHAPRQEFKALQQRYIPLFENAHVDLVLNGHTHLYERSFKNGVHYLTAGPGGGKIGLTGGDNPYSVIALPKLRTVTNFEVSSDQISGVTLSDAGSVIDQFIITKSHKLPP